MKKSFAEMLSGMEERQERKMAAKLPSWEAAGCELPSSLALEQCSSELAARYKASLLNDPDAFVADLTGGLGVDSYAFSRVCAGVRYFERNPELAAAAQRNFARLGADNIVTECRETTLDFLESNALGQLGLVFIDPARRDAAGKKVFLLEECTPNVLELIPAMFRHSQRVMIKLSPMADISMLASRLGASLKEVHVVGSGAEVRELLCVLESGNSAAYVLKLANLDTGQVRTVHGDTVSGLSGCHDVSTLYGDPEVGQLLFEPGALLLKAGVRRFDPMRKLAAHTHLFTAQHRVEGLDGFGKWFRIIEVLPFGKAGFREIQTRWPFAEVSARNVPLTSDELRKRLGVKSGGEVHVFGAGCVSTRLLIVAQRI